MAVLDNYSDNEQQFITLFAAVLNKAPTSDLIAEAKAYLDAGVSQGAILNVLFAHEQVPYAGFKPAAATNAFLATLVDNLTAGTAITGAVKAEWVTALIGEYTAHVTDGGASRGDFAALLVEVLQGATFPAGSDLAKLQANIADKAEVSAESSWGSTDGYTGWDNLADPTDSGPGPVGDDVYLDVTRDVLTGTNGNDTFYAYIFDNQNTLQSGDIVNGQGGYDTLIADVGNSQNFAITPHLTNVEKVVIRAQASRTDSGDNNIANPVDVIDVPTLIEAVQGSLINGLVGGETGVDVRGSQIDAERSVGVLHWESRNSRSDLVIEDVRILDSQITKDVTIAFVQSDPGNVDFAVYFDQHSLRKSGGTVDTSLTLSISNQLEIAKGYDASKPLDNVPYDRLTFKLNGVDKTIELDLTNVETKDQLEVAIRAAFADAAAADPTLANVTITRVPDGEKYLAKDGDPRTADQYVLTVPTGEKLETAATGWNASAGLPSNNAFAALIEAGSVSTSSLVTSTVILDDVGRGSMGGDLLIGGLSVGDTSNSRGVEQFDITVERSSKLQTIASTNNTLEVVNLVNGTTKGDLTVTGSVGSFGYGLDLVDLLATGGGFPTSLNEVIFAPFNGPLGSTLNLPVNGYFYSNGAANTDRYITSGANAGQYVAFAEDGKGKYVALGANDTSLPGSEHANTGFGFTDVRVINASEFEGRTNLSAELTYQVAEKYLNNKDGAAAQPGDDAVTFEYNLGKAGDIFQLELSAFNLAVAGTSVFNDFILSIDGGAGNDSISVHIGNAEAGANSPNTDIEWYENSKLNANLSIDAGTGDDVVRTVGTGDWIVDLGEGNDTYYADNTGNAASWVFNTHAQEEGFTFAQNLLNVQSGQNDSHVLYKAKVQVEFKGALYAQGYSSIEVEVPSTGYKTNDQQINQAIKTAVNTDPVLSKLLEAIDGPGHTLIVRSLIDGEHLVDDLTVSLVPPTTLTGVEASAYAAANGTSSATALADISAAVAAWNAGDDYAPAFGTYFLTGVGGTNSNNVADNVVTGGLGDDVLVLGTGQYSNDTVKYEGLGNGRDTIVNFDDTWVAGGTTVLPVAAVAEVVTLTFNDAPNFGAGQTLDFDGTSVVLSAPAGGLQSVIPGEDLAYQFVQALAGNGGETVTGNWEFVSHDINTNTVTIRSTNPGVVTDLVSGDFTGTYGGTVDPVVDIQGVDGGTPATSGQFVVNFTVDQTAADAPGDFTFDGQTVAYAEGDGAVTLAYKLAAVSFPNWDTVVNVAGNTASVAFTAKAPGALTAGVLADFDLVAGTQIVGSITGAVNGVAQSGPVTTVVTADRASDGTDYLDFSSYANVDDIEVNGVWVVGAATTTVGDSWVSLTERATEIGVYDIELNTVQTGGGSTAQLIAVADFGETKDFSAVHFIV